jgi:hypothetical protein
MEIKNRKKKDINEITLYYNNKELRSIFIFTSLVEIKSSYINTLNIITNTFLNEPKT